MEKKEREGKESLMSQGWCPKRTMTHGVCCTTPSDPAPKHLDGWSEGEKPLFSPSLAAPRASARPELLEKHYSRANLDKVINVERSLPSLISQGGTG